MLRPKHVHRMGRMVPTISDDMKRMFVDMKEASGVEEDCAREELDGILNEAVGHALLTPGTRLPRQEISACRMILEAFCVDIRVGGEEPSSPSRHTDWIEDTLSLIDHIRETIDRRAAVVPSQKREATEVGEGVKMEDVSTTTTDPIGRSTTARTASSNVEAVVKIEEL